MTDVVKPTVKEYEQRFINLFTEIDLLNEDVAQLKEDLKNDHAEADLANIVKVAKLKAQQKLGEVLEKQKAFNAVVEELG